MRDPANLARAGRGRPLAVLFESPSCKACAEMHADAFTRKSLRRTLAGFDVARLVARRARDAGHARRPPHRCHAAGRAT